MNQILQNLEQINKFKYNKKTVLKDAILHLHILSKILQIPNLIVFNDNKFTITGTYDYLYIENYKHLSSEKIIIRQIKDISIKICNKMLVYFNGINKSYERLDHDEDAYKLYLEDPLNNYLTNI